MEDPLIGQVLKESFRIDKILAEGGMSQVYLGYQLSLSRLVALKVLSPELNDDDFIDLFLREARVCSQINHPNVVSVLDFGQSDEGIVYLAMELLDGETLGDLITAKGPLPLNKTAWLMEQVISGVSAAHQLDVIHRDIKPNNIMISRVSGNDTVVKVLDFGISKPLSEDDLKHTRLGTVMGTAGYLAPEQIEGKRDIDKRADVYALGAILYFCLTGTKPFKGASHEIIMSKQLKAELLPLNQQPAVDPSIYPLQCVIDKAMHVDREQRYPNAKSMWNDLHDVIFSAKDSAEKVSADKDSMLGLGEQFDNDVTRYQYSFSGQAKEGIEFKGAVEKIVAVLKFSDKSKKALLSGKRIIVQKDISKAKVEKINSHFDKAGLVGQVQEMPMATRIFIRQENTSPDVSMPLIINMEPVGVSDINDLKQSKSVEALKASISPTTHLRTSPSKIYQDRVKAIRSKRKKLVSASVSALLVLALASAWFIAPVHYAIHDFWVHTIQGKTVARGVSENQINIGMSAAFNGSARELGRSMRIGVESYFHAINAQGGVHGRNLKLVAKNDSYEPAQAKENVSEFLDPKSGVLAMLGNVGTPTAKAILPAVLESNTILFGTFSGASLLRNNPPDRYVFNYRASYSEETEAIVHYFVSIKGIDPKKIAVFHQDDSFGRDGLSGVEKALTEYQVPASNIATAVYKRNTSQVSEAVFEFSQQLDEIEAVIIVGTYSASAAFTRQIKDKGFRGEIANVSFVGARALSELLLEQGAVYLDNILITQVVPHYDAYATGVLNYRNDLKAFFPNEEANFISLEAYISASIFVEGLQRAGRYFDTEILIDQLESIDALDLGIGSMISFAASNHQASHRVWGVSIQADGTFVETALK
jgi:serine/threonine protein kinase/ABC-type branched-subunit amino acid transport system substrate-binding protein